MSGSTLLPFFAYQSRAAGKASAIRATRNLDAILSFRSDFIDKFGCVEDSVAHRTKYVNTTNFERELRSVPLGDLETFLDKFVSYCKAPIELNSRTEQNALFASTQRHLLVEFDRDPAITLSGKYALYAAAASFLTVLILFRALWNLQHWDLQHDDNQKFALCKKIAIDFMFVALTLLTACFSFNKSEKAWRHRGASASNENFLQFLEQASAACDVARPKLKMTRA